jgi:Zn-dependent protease with chaperone function
MGSPLRLLTLAALAAVWAIAAFLLWDSTKVPGGIDVSGLHAKDFYTGNLLHEGYIYERFFWFDSLIAVLATILVFWLYSRYGHRFMRDSAAGPIGTGMLLAMLGFGLVWLVKLPFQIAALWWDRRHDVTHVGYPEVIFGGWFALGVQFVLLCLAVLVVMGFARLVGDRWWIPGSAFFILLFALFVFISPYVVGTSHKLTNPEYDTAAFTGKELQADYVRLLKKEHVSDLPIRVQNVHGDTSAANAFTVGFGPTKKVFLWDTLLDGRFSRGEVDFVMGHEIGHQARKHLIKAIGWYALFTIPFAYIVMLVTRRRGGIGRPEAIPLALLVVVLLNTVATPFRAAITRHMEREADWMALITTRNPASGQRLFQDFATTSLSDPNPPTWAYLWFEDHPTLMQRIGMVRAWSKRNHQTLPPAGLSK